MNTKLAKQAKLLLQMMPHSIHGPWPLFPDLDYPETPKRSPASRPSAPRTGTLFPIRSTRPRASTRPPYSAIRMQCLRLLKAEESLTACEAARRLELDEALVQSQFSELHSLRLIEKGGARKVDGQVRPLFLLNPSHPVLELLLGPAPEGSKPPTA
jgi:hypothetical protein